MDYDAQYREILELFCIEAPVGYTKEEMDQAKKLVGKMPHALTFFYEHYGRSEALQHLQDLLILPGRYTALLDEEYVIFFIENQGVCHAGIKKEECILDDPKVYVQMDQGEWELASEHVSEFLVPMFSYQASICLEYSPEEFYFITKEEKKLIEAHYQKRPEAMLSWLRHKVTMYGNNKCRISLMEAEDEEELSMVYVANDEEEFIKMQVVFEHIG